MLFFFPNGINLQDMEIVKWKEREKMQSSGHDSTQTQTALP